MMILLMPEDQAIAADAECQVIGGRNVRQTTTKSENAVNIG